MAVYGRFRERWDPTKIKSKVSKNRTFELGNTLETGKLLYWMNVESIENDHVFGNEAEGGSGLVDVFLNVFGDVDSDGNLVSSISTVPVTSAHFQPKGLQFGKTPNDDRVYVQSDENAMDVSATDLLKSTKTYDTWISFWVKVSQKNYNESLGHNMGGLYRSISTSAVEQGPTATLTLNPAVLFGITTSGAPELRLQQSGTTSNKLYYTGPTGDNDKKIEEDQWTHVTWLIKPVATGGGQKLYSQMVDLWIDGTKLTVTGNLDSALSFFLNDVNRLEVLLGNQTRGYAADGTDVAGEGFFGSIAEFMVFTYPTGDSGSRSDLAKFLYEAQREGAYHLHSGIHSSSPRLEQLDLDNDSSYPPNFSMPAYTVFDNGGYYEQDAQVSMRSVNRFTEGALTEQSKVHQGASVETWEEKAGKYYVQSNNVLPHLRLDPTDTLLTNGNWYSDARSEFFAEDLDPVNGFVVPDQSSDELYREHVTTTSIPAYRDSTVGDEYKDCFVIEIPLPNAAALQLGTDQAYNTIKESAFGVNGSLGNHSFNTMAYYNFRDGQWEHTVPAQLGLDSTADDQGILNGWDIGFGPMTGLVLPSDGRYLERFMDLYGRPMTFCGFPFHRKFEGSEGQTIDLSKYIDGPVILEGWEINTSVVPRVGYQHNLDATGTENNSPEGPSGFYNSGLIKNPFWYGAHGEAAVIWDMNNYASPFEERNFDNQYQPNGTIPIGPLPTKGTESMSNQGLITKGVTAFLLKETYAPDGPRQKSKWANNPHWLALSLFDPLNPSSTPVVDGNYSESAYNEGEANQYAQFVNMFDPIGEAYSNTSIHENGSTREIIGYLQHVYHNDPTFETVRNDWQRKYLNGDLDSVTNEPLVSNYGLRPRWKGFSFASLMDRENYTYLDPADGNLLRENTKEYPFHVSGSMKIQTPYDGGYPISLFFQRSTTTDALQPFDWQGDFTSTATANASLFSYNIFPSSEGSSANEFIQYDSLPVIAGKGPSEPLPLPKLSIPNVESHAGTIDSWKESMLFDNINVSINPDPDSDIILNPSDKLILGIQDSVSTTFMSQQTNNASSFPENGFIRWGRNALTISETTSGYLRLYVRKTRDDKPYNIVSDESNYNQNVNRDLGDHDIGDRYQVQNPKMLSGSMADDIIGPTTFTPPIFSVDVVVDSLSNISCCAGQNVYPYSWANTVNKAQSFWSSGVWDHTTALYYENFSIPWYAASAVIFADRDQGDVFPRYPSIPWEDDVLPNYNRYQWYNFSEMWQWPLAGLGDTQDDGAVAPYGWQSETLTESFRFRMFATVDEINPNSNALTSGLVINGNNTDVTRYGPRSPARSSWTLNIILPVFRKVDPYVSPFVSALPVEVRIVKIIEDDWYLDGGGSAVKESDSGNGLYIRAARYTDGTKMSVGDVFWFDPNGDCVKLDLDLDISVTIPDNQKVLRNFIQQTPSGAKLFVVGGAQDVAALGPDSLKSESNNGRGILTFKNVYSIISRLLSIHCEWDESILPVVKDGWDGDWTKIGDHAGSFSLVIPQDPAIRSILSKYQDIINASISFRLCGVKIEQDTPVGAEPNSVIDNFIRLHKDISLNGAFKALTNADFDGDFGTDDGVLLKQDTVTHNIQRTNFLADYLLPFTNGTYDNGTPVTNLTGTQITKTMFEIDYTSLPRVVPQLRIVSETYSETVGRKIDRSVQRRSTVENTNPKLGILSPGPFGSLKRYTTLSGNVPIFDSLAPSSLVQLDKGYCSSFLHDTKQECESAHQDQWVSTSYITTIVDKPQQFPHEINENKSKISVQELRIKMNTSVEGGISDINSSTNDYTNYIDNNVGEWTWQYATDSSNLFDKNGLGLLEVSNYIQENFSGIGDYQQKTINDYLMGFGNGVQGKITLRPRLYDYLAWTGDEPESFSVKFLVDPPRGSRFGLYNTSPQKSNYIFSYNHFGHLRDMLEQGTDTKFLGFEKDEKVYGSPVIVNPINPTNSEIPKLMENTSRYNKTANATIVKPYIEDNYEAIPNPVNLKAETLRVDVAGSIKTKSVLAPGNVASNIRRR